MIIIGHRGARGLAPENTIASIKKALEHHADMIEFDLMVTKDRVVVLNHDPYLTDPNGDRHVIKDFTYKELRDHKNDLATFEETLAAAGKKVSLYVEIKPEVDTRPIIKIIKDHYERGWTNLSLASFSQKTLLELHKALPELPVIVIEKWSGVRAHYRARQLGTKTVCMNQKWLWWGFIASVKRSGWTLYTYTLNDSAKASRWAKHGLAGVVTDYPDLFDKM